MKQTLLFIFAASIIINCKSPERLMKKGHYEEAFTLAYKNSSKNPKKLAKLEPILLSSYQKIYDADVKHIEQSLLLENVDFFSYEEKINSIANRANKLHVLLNIEKNLGEINALKAEVGQRAYTYYKSLYDDAWSAIIQGNKYPAPRALRNLNKMQYFNPESNDYDSLAAEIYRLGTIFTVVKFYNDSHYNYDFDNVSLVGSNEPFIKYTFDQDKPYDRILEIVIETIDPGEEEYSTSSSCYTNRVIDRYETKEVTVEVPQPPKQETETIKCGDSTVTRTIWINQPPVKKIEKRNEPVYIDVSAIVHTETLSKRGRLQMGFHVYDIKDNNEVYHSRKIKESSHSSESNSYTGDSRALTFIPSPSILNVPSDQAIVRELYQGVQKIVQREIVAINNGIEKIK